MKISKGQIDFFNQQNQHVQSRTGAILSENSVDSQVQLFEEFSNILDKIAAKVENLKKNQITSNWLPDRENFALFSDKAVNVSAHNIKEVLPKSEATKNDSEYELKNSKGSEEAREVDSEQVVDQSNREKKAIKEQEDDRSEQDNNYDQEELIASDAAATEVVNDAEVQQSGSDEIILDQIVAVAQQVTGTQSTNKLEQEVDVEQEQLVEHLDATEITLDEGMPVQPKVDQDQVNAIELEGNSENKVNIDSVEQTPIAQANTSDYVEANLSEHTGDLNQANKLNIAEEPVRELIDHINQQLIEQQTESYKSENPLAQFARMAVELNLPARLNSPGLNNTPNHGQGTASVNESTALVKSILPSNTGNTGSDAAQTQLNQARTNDKQAELQRLPRMQGARTLQRVEEVLKEVAKAKDGKSISLRLDPPQLGSVRIDLRISDGILSARLKVDNPQVALLLREHGYDLQNALRRIGLEVDEIRVSITAEEDSQQEFSRFFSNQQTRQENKNFSWENVVSTEDDKSSGQVTAQQVVASEQTLDHWVA